MVNVSGWPSAGLSPGAGLGAPAGGVVAALIPAAEHPADAAPPGSAETAPRPAGAAETGGGGGGGLLVGAVSGAEPGFAGRASPRARGEPLADDRHVEAAVGQRVVGRGLSHADAQGLGIDRLHGREALLRAVLDHRGAVRAGADVVVEGDRVDAGALVRGAVHAAAGARLPGRRDLGEAVQRLRVGDDVRGVLAVGAVG